jgi:hypothetical protein
MGLAMMEEQVQMLSKLITQREHDSPSVSPQVDVAMGNGAEIPAEPATETDTASTGEAIHNVVVIDEDEPAEHALDPREETTIEPPVTAGSADDEADIHAENDILDDYADVSMGNGAESTDGLSSELETALLTSASGAESDDGHATDGDIAQSPQADTPGEHKAKTGPEDEDQAMETIRTPEATEPE